MLVDALFCSAYAQDCHIASRVNATIGPSDPGAMFKTLPLFRFRLTSVRVIPYSATDSANRRKKSVQAFRLRGLLLADFPKKI